MDLFSKIKMEVVKYPAPSLKEKSVEVDLKDKDTIAWLMEFLGFYLKLNSPTPKAVGLACSQVGKNIRAFIALGELYVNPEIIERSRGTYETFEGCLSLEEGKQYKVRRNKEITLEWTDLQSEEKKSQKFDGFMAQVIQHEYDHLEGKLLNDKK